MVKVKIEERDISGVSTSPVDDELDLSVGLQSVFAQSQHEQAQPISYLLILQEIKLFS